MNNAHSAPDNRCLTRNGILRVLSTLLLTVGLAVLGYACYFSTSAYLFQKTETISLTNFSPEAPSIEHSIPVIPEGGTIGLIKIERLGLSAVVVEGDSSSVLRRGVGHVPGTAMPGAPGNSALSAHRDTFFRPLRKIQTGDVITLQVRGAEYAYEVESTSIVPPTAVEVLRSRGRDELTLITCYPFNYIGSAPNRFIVHAHKLPA
jgi:sortase A